MTPLEEVLKKLPGRTLADIFRVGFFDEDEMPKRFGPLLRGVYFECDEDLVGFEAIESTGTMRFVIVPALSAAAVLDVLDEDMVPAAMSLREELLDASEGRNEIEALRLWGLTKDSDRLRCNAAQFELANGQRIFVDPTYHFGIRIGGDRQRDLWLRSWPGATLEVESVLRRR